MVMVMKMRWCNSENHGEDVSGGGGGGGDHDHIPLCSVECYETSFGYSPFMNFLK